MPLTTSLPSPSIEWVDKVTGPAAMQNPTSTLGSAAAKILSAGSMLNSRHASSARPQQATASNLQRIDSYQGVGAGSANIWGCGGATPSGRGAARMNSAGNNSPTGGATCPPDWMPQLTTAGLLQNPGSRQEAAALVAVFDFHLLWEFAAGAPSPMMDHQAGIWFLPYDALCDARAVPAANLIFNNCFSGFGVFLNNVAGVASYEYVSWRGTGAPLPKTILEQVPISTAFVPQLDVWNTLRFVVIGATNDAAATVELSANGNVIVSRTFGTAVLDMPEDSIAGAPGMVCGFNTAGTNFCNGQFAMKLGRYTPSGSAIEPA